MARATLVLTMLLGFAGAAYAAGEGAPPASRAGILLFDLPADRKRVEDPEFTALRPVDATKQTYEIRIRAPRDARGSASEALDAHAGRLTGTYRVRAASDIASYSHPTAGHDIAVRGFYLGGDDGTQRVSYVYVLQSGLKCVVVEFFADAPQALTDPRPIGDFIMGCRLANAMVVVPGEPPLTEYDIEESIAFVQWLLDVSFTADQRDVFRSEIVDGWRKKDPETLQSIAQIFELRSGLATLSLDQQDLVRKQSEAQVVAELRKDASDPTTKLLLDIYDASRKPLADGTPALTRQQADSALEMFYFMAGQLEGIEAKPSTVEKETWAGRLAEEWGKLETPERNSIVSAPLVWAAMRTAWPAMSAADRDGVKNQFAKLDFIQVIRAAFAKAKSETGAADGVALMEKMSQNYNTTKMLLNTSYNSTTSLMASFGNMSGTRYYTSYRPR